MLLLRLTFRGHLIAAKLVYSEMDLSPFLIPLASYDVDFHRPVIMGFQPRPQLGLLDFQAVFVLVLG